MTFTQCFFLSCLSPRKKCICVCIFVGKKIVEGGEGEVKKELEIRYILKAFIQKKRSAKMRAKPKNSHPQKTNSSVGMLVHSEQASSHQSYVDQVCDRKLAIRVISN